MVNEDIVTALRNSVERGDSLENAMNIMIGSGYPASDVREASKFVGFVPMSLNKNNSLIMPEQKNIFIKPNNNQPIVSSQISRQLLPPKLPPPNQLQQTRLQSSRYPAVQQLPQKIPTNQDIKTEISLPPSIKNIPVVQQRPVQYPAPQPPTTRYAPQVQQPTPVYQQQPRQQIKEEVLEKPSYTKEIILLVILLLLIGILIATLLFREKILTFFS